MSSWGLFGWVFCCCWALVFLFCVVCLLNRLFKRKRARHPKATLPTAGTPHLASPQDGQPRLSLTLAAHSTALTLAWLHFPTHQARLWHRHHPGGTGGPSARRAQPPSCLRAQLSPPPSPRGGWSGGRGWVTPAPAWLAASNPGRRTTKVRQLVPVAEGGSPRSPARGRGRNHLRGSAPEAGGQPGSVAPQPRPTPDPPTSFPGWAADGAEAVLPQDLRRWLFLLPHGGGEEGEEGRQRETSSLQWQGPPSLRTTPGEGLLPRRRVGRLRRLAATLTSPRSLPAAGASASAAPSSALMAGGGAGERREGFGRAMFTRRLSRESAAAKLRRDWLLLASPAPLRGRYLRSCYSSRVLAGARSSHSRPSQERWPGARGLASGSYWSAATSPGSTRAGGSARLFSRSIRLKPSLSAGSDDRGSLKAV